LALKIKDEQTSALVRRLAEDTGQSMTAAVRSAVEEQLAALAAAASEQARAEAIEGRRRRLLAIAADAAPRFVDPWRSTPHGELLYDEHGLPA
jgi:antitoxin VapB